MSHNQALYVAFDDGMRVFATQDGGLYDGLLACGRLKLMGAYTRTIPSSVLWADIYATVDNHFPRESLDIL